MMAQRKLQQEIDKVFKRVNEGLSAFDYLYEKVINCENPSQKEKLESDLKKEIKKLQRQRDQIKNWISGNDVKDKKPLMEYRRKIERQMERFKLVERDMKTKAFSKEGLNMEKKLDPKEKEKLESSEFISENIEKINQQNETLEAQIAQIQSTVKKNKKIPLSKQNQIDSLQEYMDRNNWHLGKLETILRYLENGRVEPDQINEIKDSIVFFVENNQEPDYYDDDTVYDDLGLDQVEPTFGPVGEFVSANGNSDDEDDTNFDTSFSSITDLAQAAVPGALAQGGVSATTNTADSSSSATATVASAVDVPAAHAAPVSAPSPATAPASATPTTLADITPAMRDLSLSATSTPSKKSHEPVPSAGIPAHTTAAAVIAAAANLPTSSSSVSTSAKSQNSVSILNNLKPAPVPKVSEVKYSNLISQQQQQQQQHPQKSVTPSPPVTAAKPVLSYSKLVNEFTKHEEKEEVKTEKHTVTNEASASPRSETPATPAQTTGNTNTTTSETSVPSYLSDLLPFFEKTRTKMESIYNQTVTPNDKQAPFYTLYDTLTHQYVTNSLIYCPDSVDADKPFSYTPSKPHPTSIEYPTFEYEGKLNESSQNTSNFCLIHQYNDKRFFKKLGVETLFYIFYYGDDNGSSFANIVPAENNQNGSTLKSPKDILLNRNSTTPDEKLSKKSEKRVENSRKSLFHFDRSDQDSYIQNLALKELHSRGWRYNKKLHTWFQKFENSPPNVYKFFDFEVDWSIKLKEVQLDFQSDDFEKV